MSHVSPAKEGSRAGASFRLAWAVASFVAVQVIVCTVAALPAFIFYTWLTSLIGSFGKFVRLVIFSAAAVPAYVLFALCLMLVSPAATRFLGWRSPANAEMRIASMGWALLKWARYAASIHLVRVLAGTLFRGSPIWTAYIRANGARVGKRVFINSPELNDHNLLEFGDDVVIGSDVHISGHTVERGVVRTGRVILGSNVTIGLGTVIEIGVQIGPNCEVGALSFIGKYEILERGGVYVGIPVRRVSRS